LNASFAAPYICTHLHTVLLSLQKLIAPYRGVEQQLVYVTSATRYSNTGNIQIFVKFANYKIREKFNAYTVSFHSLRCQ